MERIWGCSGYNREPGHHAEADERMCHRTEMMIMRPKSPGNIYTIAPETHEHQYYNVLTVLKVLSNVTNTQTSDQHVEENG